MTMQAKPYDVLVIGSGAAGLTAALSLAETRRVLVLAKGQLTSGSTAWAQGGIAAVLDAGDTFEDHIRDTMVAGAGLNDRETVEFVIEGAPRAIDRLIELGVPFNKESGDLHLTREGGHSHRRIVHVDDATGWAVQAALLKAAKDNPNITLLPDRTCVELITGRHERTLFRIRPRLGRLCARHRDGQSGSTHRARHHHGGRRGGPRLSVQHRPARGYGRWHCDGLASGRARFQYGNDAVSSHVPV